MPRKYELRERAEKADATRRRIVEAANSLHATVGFVDATISAVAREAGVQRLTIYRHFPTERDLVGACAGHFFSSHPVPDLEPFAAMREPEQRLRRALLDLYGWYGSVEGNMANFLRDAPAKPFLYELGRPLFDYFEALRALLVRGWGVRGRRKALVGAAVGHATAFATWQSLVRQEQLRDEDAVELLVAATVAAAAPSGGPRSARGRGREARSC
jgi:AcrR family transcriptional regulator